MDKCRKYRALPSHHMNPSGGCAGCVYFSSRNCGTHTGIMSQNDGNFFAMEG
jgi:hypothetical protein